MATIAATLSVVVKAIGVKKANAEIASTGVVTQRTARQVEASTAAAAKATAASSAAMATSFAKAGQSMRKTGTKMTTHMTLPIVALGAAAAKMSLEFEDAMDNIVGLVGVSRKQVEKWSDEILNMAKTLPQAPKELADALFFITSAGLRGSAAMDALRESAKASAAGLGETKVIADAVTSAMSAYGAKTVSAAHATDVLVGAVREGKTQASSLAPVLGRVIPIAEAMGVSFDQVGASMASMTRTGSSAAQAATSTRAILSTFAKPSKQTSDALKKVGLSVDDVRKSLRERGMLDTLIDLRKRAEESGVDLSSLFGNVRALGGVLTITGRNVKQNVGIFKRMSDVTGSTNKAFAVAAEDGTFKLQRAFTAIKVALIRLGNVLVPTIKAVALAVADAVVQFGKLPKPVQQVAVVAALVLAALGPLVFTFGALASVIGFLAANPIVLLIAALAALATGLVYAYKHSEEFREIVQAVAKWALTAGRNIVAGFRGALDWIAGAWHDTTTAIRREVNQWDTLFSAVAKAITLVTDMWRISFNLLKAIVRAGLAVLLPLFRGAWEVIKGMTKAAWSLLKGYVLGGLQAIRGVIKIIGGLFKGDFGQIWDGVKDIFRGAFTVLKGYFTAAKQTFSGAIKGIKTALVSGFMGMWDAIKGVFKDGANAVISFLNVIIDAINLIPGVPDIKRLAPIGGGGGGGAMRPAQHNLGQTGHLAAGGAFRRTMGKVRHPMVMLGEDAPRHPEFVIPTNPAYRKRARGLLAQAAGAIGFASGGVLSLSQLARLWKSANDGLGSATLMAHVAMAESGGDPGARNPSGASGLWQILGLPFPGNPFDPFTNARMAGSKLRTQGLGAWAASRGAWGQFVGDSALDKISGAIGILNPLNILKKLPSPADMLPDWLVGTGKYVIGKVTKYIKDTVGGVLGGSGHPGAGGGGPSKVVAVGKWLQSLGYLVSEHPAFGGVSRVHTDGSYHYAPGGRAIDVNWANASEEPAMLDRIFPVLKGMNPLELLWRVKDHFDHLHVAFQKGGLLGSLGGTVGTGINFARRGAGLGSILRGARKGGPHRRRKIKRLLSKYDLPHGMMSQLSSLQTLADTYDTFAQRAGALDAIDENGVLTKAGLVNGKTQEQWLRDELTTLMDWRNKLIAAIAAVAQRRQQIAALLVKARERLAKIRGEIFNRAQRIAESEALLRQLRKHPRKNHKQIVALQDHIRGLNRQQGGAMRARETLKTVIGSLVGRRGDLGTQIGSLRGTLESVHGLGSSMEPMTTARLGELGGRIFDVQMSLRDIGARPTGVASERPATPAVDTSALEELLRQANLRFAVSQAQYGVLSRLPYGGSFAGGGVVPGAPGSPVLITAHGGEVVNDGVPVVHITFPGALSFLERFVRVEVQKGMRQEARGARTLPGRPGALS